MYKTKLKGLLGALVLALLLVACGGGDNPPSPTDSSNWDEMVWDQDQWQ